MSQTVPGSEADITAATDVGGGPGISGADLAENDDGQDRIAYELGGQAFATNSSGADPVALGAATGGPVATTVDPDGGGVSVWPGADSSGLPEVDVLDQFPTGGSQSAQLVADLPGPITGQSVGVAPGGDAVIAWMQGAPGDSEVVGDVVSVAPHTFTVTTPTGWQSAAGATVTWNPAAATTTVTYAIYVDGRLVLGNIAGPPATAPSTDPNFPSQPVSSTAEAVTISRHLPVTGIGTGVHEVQVVATDALGQTLASSEQKLKLDDTPPQVSLATADDHHAARVTVSDPDSGVAAQATRIDFGVGATVAHKVSATHVYNAPGTYPVTVHAVDKAGNATTVELKVTVR
jgi:PKD repeat protein